MKKETYNNLFFSTSIDSYSNKNHFMIEPYLTAKEMENSAEPEKVIRNFDELILFLEEINDEKEIQELH